MPVHLRWELYPVAHEIGRPYGGSYLEEENWWKQKRKINPLGESTVFLREIIFFREYFHSNRRFWILVYPFHIGLFLLIVWALLLIVHAILSMNGSVPASTASDLWLQLVYYLTLITGVAAFILGILATAGLLIKRSLDEDLRNYTAPIDYFNLSWILTIFLAGLLFWSIEDPSFSVARSFLQGVLSFNPTGAKPLITTFLILSMLFLAYMPFTRMVHYVAKYFTYHKIRWDDEPNIRGSKLEEKLQHLLNQTESWSAPHIQAGKTWSEQAAGSSSSQDGKNC
jgi:nitrate reductase gamma subunit